MARGKKLENDEFVFTIDSDDENQHVLGLEEEESEDDTAPVNGKKRKRQHEATIGLDATKGKKRRQQKQQDDEEEESDSDAREARGWADQAGEADGALNPDFEFQLEQDAGIVEDFDVWEETDSKDTAKKGVDMDELIARRQARREKRGTLNEDKRLEQSRDHNVSEEEFEGGSDSSPADLNKEAVEGSDSDELEFGKSVSLGGDSDEDEDRVESNADLASERDGTDSEVADDMDADHLESISNSESDDEEDPEELARQKAFFAPEETFTKPPANSATANFQNMKLSRPILRGLNAIGFLNPTPIQTKTIPIALLGKDIVGGAVTGSGKTGAFMIPILERLLYRNQKVPTSRVAVLMPTRELAVQCYNVAIKLASYTDITFCQLVGGFSLREQEVTLRKRPDVIIATPGRFIDHMRNSASFTIDTLEILVLDEADRMLEQGFADELNEILTTIPRSRQTMLFSATMTNTVDKLIKVGLNKPVRLMVDAKKQTVGTLTQEFVRLREGREDKRLAYLLHLCSTIYTERCIIFFRQKKEAHRVRIVFGLCGLKVAELHGSMSQDQRISSVESFRAGKATHLLATDVASRGLDIKGVEAVINYEAPQSHEIYLHRVGRTARAGRSGRACTLAAETDRKVVRAAVKTGKSQGAKIVSRVVEAKLADEWAERVDSLKGDVEDLLREEKEERQIQSAEMQVRKGENLIAHEKEIMSRPKREWFQTEKDKLAAKKAGIDELNGSLKKNKVKLSNKDKKKLDSTRDRKENRMWKKGKDERGVRSVGKKPSKTKQRPRR